MSRHLHTPVHPRPRGEHGLMGSPLVVQFGSSPPARGTPLAAAVRRRVRRFIPARAGNTLKRGKPDVFFAGSSPPARGTLLARTCSRMPKRFIPARAGNTLASPTTMPPSPVHPRPRGEHFSLAWLVSPYLGSSPPARGTREWRPVCWALLRFIPARAGNTLKYPGPRKRGSVHPRPRGEHVSMLSKILIRVGSSPPARGTRRTLSTKAAARSVHPRPRGEHIMPHYIHDDRTGSSPPARGTH